MWESGVSVSLGTMLMAGFWGAAFIGIGIGWLTGLDAIGQFGLALACLASALMVMSDNQRTRRMLARPGEHLRPLR